MTLEEIKEKYGCDESGYVYCSDCPLSVKDENGKVEIPNQCLGYVDFCDGFEEAYVRIQKYLEDKEKMVVLYVDWEKKDIISEGEYKEMVEELEDTNGEEFFCWLNLRYSAGFIFQMSEEGKKDVKNKFLAECRKDAKETCSRYQRVEVEL